MRRTIAAMAIISMAIAGCGGSHRGRSEGLLVVVTTTILGDIVRNVTGNDARVEVLYPVGADAHDYQPSARQIASVNEADLVVANGLGLEEGLLDAISAAEFDGVRVLEVGAAIDPLAFVDHNDPAGSGPTPPCGSNVGDGAPQGGEAERQSHDGACDPHFWMDPLRDAKAARVIADELTAIDASFDWSSRAEAYAEELAALDAEIISTFDAIPADGRKMVTNHEAFGYLADRYGFEIVGTVIPGGSTLGDPSSEDLAQLVAVIEDESVKAIFTETVEPTVLADAIAAEIGHDIAVVELYTESLGEADSDGATLVGLLRTNASRIADVLG